MAKSFKSKKIAIVDVLFVLYTAKYMKIIYITLVA